jgi:hypothetical protein
MLIVSALSAVVKFATRKNLYISNPTRGFGTGDGLIVFAADSRTPLSSVAASGGEPVLITALRLRPA